MPAAGVEQPGEAATSAARAAAAVPVSVLLVDDRMSNLTALEAVLEPLKVNLVKATSGEEALWKLLEREYALVLLDVQMPGLDGFRVAQIIRERPSMKSLPIIFLTALSREAEHIFRGYEQGAVDYLVKPFDANVLRAKVSVFIELFRKTKLVELQGEQLRKKEREALQRQNEERFQELVEAMPVCVWAMTGDGRCHYANRRALACVPQFAPAGATFIDALHPEDRPRVEVTWAAAQKSAEPFQLECRLKHGNVWRWSSLHGVPKDDPTAGWLVSAADIDRSKTAEQTLLEKEKQLQLANQAKDDFLAAASHELRSPLTAAKLALRKVTPEKAEISPKTLALLARQVNRMHRLVEDLLDVTRLQSGRLELDVEELDVAQLASEVHERVDGSSERHVFRCEVPQGLKLRGDRGRLDQVLTNLLSNAVRYSPDGGEVVLGAKRAGDRVHFWVSDQGVGVPKEKQRQIFERFGQAHGARYGGLGLGLTIAEGIVLQHGGRIWVESQGLPGRGSTFHVELPGVITRANNEPVTSPARSDAALASP